jgi:threonine dehydratase
VRSDTPGSFSADDVAREVGLAAARIGPYIRETPLEFSPSLSRSTGARVFLKLENTQVTGSFKARGAFNKLLSLSPADRARGIVTASTGNHALATVHALSVLGIAGEIFLPRSASPIKIAGLELRGATLQLVDEDPGTVEIIARRHAEQSGRTYVSPYNDPQVLGGQGTIAVELLRQAEHMDAVFVPVGGGGLIAGIAGYLAASDATCRIVGCQPENSPILARSTDAGRLLDMPYVETLSDATVGLVEPGAITFPICQTCVDDWVLVGESEIRAAIRLALADHSLLIEGAAALSIAALVHAAPTYHGQSVVLVLSGSHIAPTTLAAILNEA